VEQSRSERKELEGSVTVPAAVVAAAAGAPIPIPLDFGLDVGASVSLATTAGEKMAFTAPGEQVFAVQYRKIRFAWFSSRYVDKAYLEEGNRWKIYIMTRGESEEGVNDGIDMEVDEPVGLQDLRGPYESFKKDDEEILYRFDDEDKN